MLRFTARCVGGCAVFALACGCGGSSATHAPPAGGGSGQDASAGNVDDASTAGTSDGGSPGSGPAPGTSACPGSDAGITAAPVDTAAATAATGPYLWRGVTIVAGGFVTGVVFSPAQQDVVYARTDIGGAYRWNAASGRWMPLLDWVARSNSNWGGAESIAADPRDANKVYIAAGMYVTSGSGAFFKSTDQGRTFETIATQIPMGSNNDGRSVGERLAVDPNNTSVLYFGSRTTGLWKSANAAESWTQVTSLPGLAVADAGAAVGPATTPNGVGVPFVEFDPASCGSGGQTTVYASIAVTGTSLFRSTDGGATWTAVPGQPTGMLPSHAAIGQNGMLYVTYGGGTGINGDGPNNVTTGAVYRMDIGSGVWTNVTPATPGTPTFGYAGVSVDAQHPGTLVVSTLDRWATGDDIYRSTDSGAHWTAVGVPKAAHDVSAAPWVTFHAAAPNYTGWMSDVAIDPFNASRVLHVTGQGIWGSDDLTAVDSNQATHWDFRSVGIEETAVNDLASPPSGPSLLSAVGDIGGFRHDDLTVSPAGGMSSNPVFTSTDGVDYAELNPSIVARVGRGGATTSPHGAFSTDGGSTWQPFPKTLPISTATAGSIAVSADGSTFVWDPPAATGSVGGPQYSHDSGQTWTASTGIGAIRPVIADRVNPMKFYAFDAAMGRVFVSTDQAATFTVAATGLPTRGSNRLRATPGVEGDLWLYANGNLLHSTSGGASFTSIGGPTAVFALGLGMAPPGQTYPAVFVGGTVNQVTGIFRSDDQGATFTRVDDDQHKFATATVIVGDPRVYGRVYVGNNGRGILYGQPAAAASP